MSVANAQLNRLTRVLESNVVLASGVGGMGASNTGSPESGNRREYSNRFVEQILEQFWLYTDPI